MGKLHFEVVEDAKMVIAISRGECDSLARQVAKQLGISKREFEEYMFSKGLGVDTEYDNSLCMNKLFIADVHKGIVKCHEDDTFDIEVGKKEAAKKVARNIEKAKEKALARWKKAMVNKVNNIKL